MSKSIYLNSAANTDRRHDSEDSKNIYEDMTRMRTINQQLSNSVSGTGTAGSRCSRLAAVCLGLLCVLLLVAITVLWVKFTAERDQLETSNKNLTIEGDRLQSKYNAGQKKKEECDLAEKTQGWRCFSSSMYFISTGKMSWSDSRQDCRERGADLVIINSKEEQDFVEMFRRDSRTWIGLNRGDTKGIWEWVDGKVLNIGYWEPGKPNNSGWSGQDCAVTGSAPGRGWNDKHCQELHFWICEKQVLS